MSKIANAEKNPKIIIKEELAMKKIRLEFPIGWGKDPNVFLPEHVWLKVVDDHTEAFKDKEFKQAFPQTEEKISLEVEVPEELEGIEVIPPGGITPTEDITMGWCSSMADSDWKMPGLKKISVITENKVHEVNVIGERPDLDGWRAYTRSDRQGAWLFMKLWALTVYTLESKTIAAFHWHSKLSSERRYCATL